MKIEWGVVITVVLICIVLLFTLSGCASVDMAQRAIAGNGAKVADEVQQSAEWTLCNGISVGAWRRAYAGNSAKSSGWSALCSQAEAVPQ